VQSGWLALHNALTQQIECSGLVCTRKEGALKNQLDSKVAYLFR
jgi:hypothetical protein